MARGPQAIAQPGGSVAIAYSSTTASIQTAINANAPGTTFWIEKGGGTGVRAQTVALVPKTGDVFVFELGAVLDGSTWVTSDTTQASFRAHNENIDTVTIRNATIQNMPRGGIRAYKDFSQDWTIENCTIDTVGGVGVSVGSGVTVQRCRILRAAVGGYSNFQSTGAMWDDNEIAFCGREQKFVSTIGVVVSNSWYHDNDGAGVWFDTGNSDYLVEDNTFEDNGEEGINLEISYGGIIRRNSISGSGLAGLYISTTQGVEAYENDLVDNWRGIQFFLNTFALSDGWDLADNYVHDNTITLSTRAGSIASLLSYTGTLSSTALAPYVDNTKNNLFIDNTYTAPSTGTWWYWGTAHKTWEQWQALPQDAAGMEFPGGSPSGSPGGSPGGGGGGTVGSGGGGGTYIPVNSLFFAPYDPDDYGSFVSTSGVFLGVPANDPLFDTDGAGTVTNGMIQLDNGRICVTNLGNFQVGVFNADGTLRSVDPSTDPCSIAGGYANTYFYGVRWYTNPIALVKYSSDDSSTVTTWSLGEVNTGFFWALGVADDESVAYFGRTDANSSVLRRDLGALSTTTFATVASNNVTGQNSIVVLRNGEVLIAWTNATIVHYSAAGAVLHTYTRSGVFAITPGLTDASFWVHYDTGTSHAQEILISDGTLLHDFALPTGDPPAAHAGGPSTNWGLTFCTVRAPIGTEFTVVPPPGTVPGPIPINSVPCCDTGGGPPGPNPGPVLQGFGWTPRCDGGGSVPSAPALTDSENWDV